MVSVLRRLALQVYERSLEREITDPPKHVAVIQDGNRRFARREGRAIPSGHRAGARTTERVLNWCREVGVEELTLYAFSTENFNRPSAEREQLFDLLTEKLNELADRPEIHENGVRITTIGQVQSLPARVQQAVAHAEQRTDGYDEFRLNIALAYGGRAELLEAARTIAREVARGDLDPVTIDATTLDNRLAGDEVTAVDLIIRTGGDERTSNFLPWHANGNEAAVYFCTPYWPEFSRRDFLRAIRTYQYREAKWEQSRHERAVALVRAFGDRDLPAARAILGAVTNDVDQETELPNPVERPE